MIELRPSGIPIYLQIYTALRTDIERGVLPPGHRLEPERKLAQELNINRATVTRAYQKLAQDGFILSRKGSFSHGLPPAGTSAHLAGHGSAVCKNAPVLSGAQPPSQQRQHL